MRTHNRAISTPRWDYLRAAMKTARRKHRNIGYLYDKFNGVCQICKEGIGSLSECHVDHVVADPSDTGPSQMNPDEFIRRAEAGEFAPCHWVCNKVKDTAPLEVGRWRVIARRLTYERLEEYDAEALGSRRLTGVDWGAEPAIRSVKSGDQIGGRPKLVDVSPLPLADTPLLMERADAEYRRIWRQDPPTDFPSTAEMGGYQLPGSPEKESAEMHWRSSENLLH